MNSLKSRSVIKSLLTRSGSTGEHKSILVIGGVGFLGSSLVCQLIRKGHSVKVLDSLQGEMREDEVPVN